MTETDEINLAFNNYWDSVKERYTKNLSAPNAQALHDKLKECFEKGYESGHELGYLDGKQAGYDAGYENARDTYLYYKDY